MKRVITYIFFFFWNFVLFSQNIETTKESIISKIEHYNDSIEILNSYHELKIGAYKDTILHLQKELQQIIRVNTLNESKNIKLIAEAKFGATIKFEAKGMSSIIYTLDKPEKVKIMGYENSHFEVCLDTICGFMSEVWVNLSPDIEAYLESKKTALLEEQNKQQIEQQNNLLEKYGNIYVDNLRVMGANSAGGVGFILKYRFSNPSKTIKYMSISVIPYNNVGDVQTCEITGQSHFTGLITGPIKSKDLVETARWENSWYNNTITCVKITKLRVEYIDGSVYTYLKELPKILGPTVTNDCSYKP